MKTRSCVVLVMALLLAGAVSPCWADSLFNKEAEDRGSLIADSRKQFEEGDIITVLVQENIDAQTQADTNTKKESGVQSQAPAASNPFLVAETPGGLNIIPEETLPNWDISMKNESKNKGTEQRKNRLVMTVACVVKKVHENGNLDIKGNKQVTVNREDCLMNIAGIIRTKDVTPANTINSSQVAEAKVELKGKGPLWNNQRRGFLTRVLDWFSPF